MFVLSHSLTANLPDCDSKLRDLALQLGNICGNVNRMRYPDCQGIPADKYPRELAKTALQISEEIVNYVSKKYFPE